MNLLRELRHSNVVIYMGACLEQARPTHSSHHLAFPGRIREALILCVFLLWLHLEEK